MSDTKTYTIQQAVLLMKNLSRRGKSFTVNYLKAGGGRGTAVNYRLIKKNLKNDSRGKYKLQLINDNDQRKSCYIPLLMSVNGVKIEP